MSEAEKKARLAEALRVNLRKRKTQARAQATVGDPPDSQGPDSQGPDSQSDATHSDTRSAAS